MMIYRILVVVCLGFSLRVAASPNVEEEVFLSVNNSTLISGETLLYSAFVYSKKTGRPTTLSKVLYVELLNENGKVSFQAKVSIKEGRGSGEIFIPSTYKTGPYTLVAYTRWMRNFDSVFNMPIIIVNPFQELDEKYLSTASSVQNEWKMDFNPTGGSIVTGLDNTIGFVVKQPTDSVLGFKGKVVNLEGAKLTEFTANASGQGKIRLKPKSNEPLRVILEDSHGRFHFFDLPSIVDQGSTIRQENFGSFIVFSVQSTSVLFRTDIVVIDDMGNETNYPLNKEGSVKVEIQSWKQGSYQVLAKEENKVLSSTHVYIGGGNKQNQNEDIDRLFSTRSKVSIEEELPKGSYSITVSKRREWVTNYTLSTQTYRELFRNHPDYALLELNQYRKLNYSAESLSSMISKAKKTDINTSSVSFLPEMRGELITGNVTTGDSTPLSNHSVILGTVDALHLSMSTTDEEGKFTFNLASKNENVQAYIAALDQEDYSISVDNTFIKEHMAYANVDFKIDSLDIADIVKSSLNSQLENVYYEEMENTFSNSVEEKNPYDLIDFSFQLDDYNRFKTIKETITEYIIHLAVRKTGGEEYILVRQDNVFSQHYQPLIVLDGIPISALEALKLSSFKIKEIKGTNRRVYIGDYIYDGFVVFNTIEGNMHGWEVDPNYSSIVIQGLEKVKKYQFPDYSNNQSNHEPDQREQLYWNPLLNVNSDVSKIEFYTSDVEGTFDVEINGFTTTGKAYYKQFSIEVAQQ